MNSNFAKEKMLQVYEHTIEDIRLQGKECNLDTEDNNNIISESLKIFDRKLNARKIVKPSCFSYFVKLLFVSTILALTVYVIVFNHKPTYSFIVRNVQEYIYPTMKFVRWLSLPLVKRFTSITALYDEMCLLENPFFQEKNVDCWPCEEVRSILDLTGYSTPQEYQPHSAFPYAVKGVVNEVLLRNLEELYEEKKAMFDKDAYRVTSNVQAWSNIEAVMHHKLHKNPTFLQNGHVTWRMNRLEAVREVRKLFIRPSFLPSSVNVERFIFIDENNSSSYILPFPEGDKVYLMQCSGERLIILEPVEACQLKCSKVSVLLQTKDFLFYSSWFYRARSFAVDSSKSISISYLGSFN